MIYEVNYNVKCFTDLIVVYIRICIFGVEAESLISSNAEVLVYKESVRYIGRKLDASWS